MSLVSTKWMEVDPECNVLDVSCWVDVKAVVCVSSGVAHESHGH